MGERMRAARRGEFDGGVGNEWPTIGAGHGFTVVADGTTHVVRGIDLQVHEGEIFGILGPTGAGKTTTVECIGGLRTRDGGDIQVAGFDPADEKRGLIR